MKSVIFTTAVLLGACSGSESAEDVEYETHSSAMTTGGEADQESEKHEESIYVPGQWGFTSDHLPVGARVQARNIDFRVASFNVLDEIYKKNIYEGQGLGGTTLDLLSEEARTAENIKIVVDGLEKYDVSIFVLQEASMKFVQTLRDKLAPQYKLYNVKSGTKDDYGVLVYDSSKFEVTDPDLPTRPHPYIRDNGAENKYMQTIVLRIKSTDETITVVNTHAEFGKADQLITYLNRLDGAVLAMGDLNLGYHDTKKESDISILNGLKQGYSLLEGHTPFSHVNTEKKLDVFDHFIHRNLTVTPDKHLTASLQSTFSLTNRQQL